MEEALGRSLATGNTAEIFEWGSRVVKLYKSPAANEQPSMRQQRAQPWSLWDFRFREFGMCMRSEADGE